MSTKQATKTKDDLGDYLDKMHAHQARLLEKALGACERQYGGGAGRGARVPQGEGLPVIAEVGGV